MSNDKLSKTDCPSETMELPGPPFSVEDISQQGDTQTETLLENQKTLLSLQATLSTMEKKGEMAEMELRSKAREILIVVNGMEHLEQQTKILHDRCVSISKENMALQAGIIEEEEDARTALAKFNSYRNKMEAHRMAVLRVMNHTEAHKLLEEKRAFARRLIEQKEELREDLKNPNGRMVQMAKREIDALKEKISVMRKAAADMRERLRKEFETHAEIKKDIEIQNRRYEAIVKRLHCQLIRAQAQYRQAYEDIYHMERELAELKRQLESSTDSALSGQ